MLRTVSPTPLLSPACQPHCLSEVKLSAPGGGHDLSIFFLLNNLQTDVRITKRRRKRFKRNKDLKRSSHVREPKKIGYLGSSMPQCLEHRRGNKLTHLAMACGNIFDHGSCPSNKRCNHQSPCADSRTTIQFLTQELDHSRVYGSTVAPRENIGDFCHNSPRALRRSFFLWM